LLQFSGCHHGTLFVVLPGGIYLFSLYRLKPSLQFERCSDASFFFPKTQKRPRLSCQVVPLLKFGPLSATMCYSLLVGFTFMAVALLLVPVYLLLYLNAPGSVGSFGGSFRLWFVNDRHFPSLPVFSLFSAKTMVFFSRES